MRKREQVVKRLTMEETLWRQYRKTESALAGLNAKDVFSYAFRRGWLLGRQRLHRGQRRRAIDGHGGKT